VQDDQNNRLILSHPLLRSCELLERNQMDEEEAFISALKVSDIQKSHKGFKDHIEMQFPQKLNKFLAVEKQFIKLWKNIENSLYYDEDPFYILAYEYLKQDNLRDFFVLADIQVVLNFVHHKRVRGKIEKIWKEIDLIQSVPREILQNIFTYLDVESLKVVSYATSKHLDWVKSDESMIQTMLKKSNSIKEKVFSLCTPFKDTPQFQLMSRILPYELHVIAEPLNLYENLYLLSPRELNPLELSIFKLHGTEKPKPKSIVSFSQFLKNFQTNFQFDKWKNFLDWDYFQIIGGSVLKCLLQDPFMSESQDIDIFCQEDDVYNFDEYLKPFSSEMKKYNSKETFIGSYQDRVRSISVKIGKKEITFQFILYPMLSYQRLDQDCCQVGFNGTEVMGTHSFIQSLNTGTMINYHLESDEVILFKTNSRIQKYISRGFNFLYPKEFDFENAEIEDELEEDLDDDESKFGENVDEFGVVEATNKLLFQQFQ
jgi:hypothetical protein